jgi:universal stress protein A
MKPTKPKSENPLEEPPQALHVKKVLVPIDFSGPSKKAFKYALGFAQQFGSEIILTHVLEPHVASGKSERFAPEIAPSAQDEWAMAEKNLQALASSAPVSGNLYITSALRRGVATHEILEVAKEFDVDLIITSTHGLTGWKHFGMGSTADRIARAAPCPVLVVREKEREFI